MTFKSNGVPNKEKAWVMKDSGFSAIMDLRTQKI